jgi:hypothetical protein
MPNYFVSYDLIAPQKNYPRVEVSIQSLGPSNRLLYSVWFVKSNLNIEAVRDHIAAALDSNDKLLVIEAAGATGQRLDNDTWQKLRSAWRDD